MLPSGVTAIPASPVPVEIELPGALVARFIEVTVPPPPSALPVWNAAVIRDALLSMWGDGHAVLVTSTCKSRRVAVRRGGGDCSVVAGCWPRRAGEGREDGLYCQVSTYARRRSFSAN